MTATESSQRNGASGWVQLKKHARSPAELHAALQAWMRRQLHDPLLTIGPLETPGGTGIANETLLFDARFASDETRGFVARIATADPLYLEDDLYKHFQMYSTMAEVDTVPTPNVVSYEHDSEHLGAPFFVMEKVDGVIATDNPPWWTEGFIAEATPEQRRQLWEGAVGLMARFHRIDPQPFEFLRSGRGDDGVADDLDYWMRALRWAASDTPIPLTEAAEQWLVAHRPAGTGLSWGDSRLPNVIYRDFTPVAMLDWDLVSLAGAQADLAWWIIMSADAGLALDGIGDHDALVDLWEAESGLKATNLKWYLVLGAYRLAAILAKLMATFVAQGRMPADMAASQLATGLHVQLLAGLLELPAPAGVEPMVPQVRLDR